MLPEAEFAFLDELFNANSAILNNLLTVLNERIYRRGSEIHQLPLLSLFAASNHLPEDEALRQFVYHSAHLGIMRRRREWFERMSDSYLVLWWVPRGHRPDVAQAIGKLEALRRQGPHREAFTFGQLFPAPDAPPGSRPVALNDPCPAS